MAAISRPFRRMFAGIGGPLIDCRLLRAGRETSKLVALVDTGATWSILDWPVARRQLGMTADELERMPSRKLHGVGGIKRFYRVIIERLVVGVEGADPLILPDATVYVSTESNLPQSLLLGQRCVLERLWLYHDNTRKNGHFVLGDRRPRQDG